MQQSTGAHSQYNAGIFQIRKRVTGVWGGSFSYTYSRLNDNQWGESNYYTSNPGIQNNYEVIPGSPYYNPDPEYGRSLLDSPHKIVIAPTFMLPFGEGHKFLGDSRIGNALLGGWSITPVATIQSGFPMGVTQLVTTSNGLPFLFGGTPRPNLVPGQDILTAGDITDRITANTDRQPLLQQGGVLDVGGATRSATRRGRSRACCRRGATTSTCRSARTCKTGGQTNRDHPPRGAEHVQHRPVGGAGELGVRQLGVRPDQQSGEQHADDSVHAAIRLLKAEGRTAARQEGKAGGGRKAQTAFRLTALAFCLSARCFPTLLSDISVSIL